MARLPANWQIAIAATLLTFLVSINSARADDVFTFNKKLNNGINLGNALEAPKEGEWGVTLQPEYFKLIRDAGFDHVRLPVRWSSHYGHYDTAGGAADAGNTKHKRIDPAFFARVDWAIDQARANHLLIIVNMHHYEELETDVAGESANFLAMWREIAEHLRAQNGDLAFELYNEPSKTMSAEIWNELFARTLKIVRANNPDRPVVVGPVGWNSINNLESLRLPDDKNLLATVHYYEPFHFTHQGASWVSTTKESDKWLGTKWTGSAAEVTELRGNFAKAKDWARKNNRPMYLGEYGAYEKCDMASRALWTRAVHDQAVADGFSRAYWEFCSGFGAWDPQQKKWRPELLRSLCGFSH